MSSLLFRSGEATGAGCSWEESLFSQFLRGGCISPRGGPRGEAPGSVKRQKEQEKIVGRSLYCGFCRKERLRQGQQDSGWLVGIISGALGCRGCPWLPDTWPSGDSGGGTVVQSLRERRWLGCGLRMGWFAYEKHAQRQACGLQSLGIS